MASTFLSVTLLLALSLGFIVIPSATSSPVYGGVFFTPISPRHEFSAPFRAPLQYSSPAVVFASSLDELHMLHSPLVAWGYFNDTINTTGWSFLSITTNISATDEEQAYAAGYLEGKLTVQRIWQYIANVLNSETGYSHALAKYVDENNAWVSEQGAQHFSSDSYWRHVSLLYTQNLGMYDGYSEAAPPAQQLTYDVFYAASLQGDKVCVCVCVCEYIYIYIYIYI